MKILLTGVTGAIGSELLPKLLSEGHEVVVLARKPFHASHANVTVIEGDLMNAVAFPEDIDVAYYLVHSMTKEQKNYGLIERKCAEHFVTALKKTHAKQIIYLSAIANESEHTNHIDSRLVVEEILKSSEISTTILRAGIIIGKKSASFKIILDLVNRLPVMIPPKWIHNLCQPIAMEDVIYYLTNVILHEDALDQTFDIGGPDILSYKNMLLGCAVALGKRRLIISAPVLTPYLANLWLVMTTDVNFTLCKRLVENLKNNFICKDRKIQTIFTKPCLSYHQALAKVCKPKKALHEPMPVS